MVNANMKKMMKMITEQFLWLALFDREPGTFPSQLEANSKGLASSCSSSEPSPT